ncbi:MAG: metallophosphoesterase family protein [Chloroflexi bacterium]|nr:metallophosphoesterase family protein [Chloroflexota bacterium]
MRYLILSDIHSNLPALEAVLQHAAERGFDLTLCLGDIVGYGPYPNQCTEWVREHTRTCLAGNHDWAVIDKMDIADFNPTAAQATLWTREQLKPENQAYLQERPTVVVEEGFTLTHGSLREPVWEYITDNWIAQQSFELLTTTLLFHGHTHIPAVFREQRDRLPQIVLPRGEQKVILDQGRFLINPGGVGQPRDGDPRASYLIYDQAQSAVEFYRVDYPIAQTQEAILQAGLPKSLAQRLSLGQ